MYDEFGILIFLQGGGTMSLTVTEEEYNRFLVAIDKESEDFFALSDAVVRIADISGVVKKASR